MKVLVFPLDNNPYQRFLYENMVEKNDVSVKYLKFNYSDKTFINLILLFLNTLINRFKGYTIYHLHFIYNFNSNSKNTLIKKFANIFYFIYIILYIIWIKIVGYKLVWTLHDIHPHDKQTINDLYITKFIYNFSDVVIMHTEMSKNELKDLKLNPSKVHIIPIGNYNNYYENNISISESRNKLGIKKGEFVYLFFGLIKQYKGVDDLIDAFNEISLKYDNLKLLIVGDCSDKKLKSKLQKSIKGNKNIITKFQFIEKNEVQYYFNTADVVVLPFRKITTSSTTLLSFAFSKPIIFSRIGDLLELPENIGYTFKNDDLISLQNALIRTYENKEGLIRIGENANLYSKKFDWNYISKVTFLLYKNI